MEKTRVSRKLLVNKKMQLTVLFYSLVLAMWVSVTNVIFQLIFTGQFGIVSRVSIYILIPAALMVIISITIFCGFLLTNRIAGPLHKLRNHMEDAAEGKTLETINFRKDDYFAEIIEPYNKIVEQLRQRK